MNAPLVNLARIVSVVPPIISWLLTICAILVALIHFTLTILSSSVWHVHMIV